MTISADTLQLLIDAGLGGAELLAVVRSIEADNSPSRTSGAERQRRYRERKRAAEDGDGHCNVTRDVTQSDAAPALSPSFPPDPQTNPIPTPVVSISRARGPKFPPPEGVSAEQWEAFVEHRRCHKKGGKLTEHAYRLLCKKLAALAEDGWPPGEMTDLAIERGWITVFKPLEPRDGYRTNRNAVGGDQPDSLIAAYREACAEVAAERGASEADPGAWPALPSGLAGTA